MMKTTSLARTFLLPKTALVLFALLLCPGAALAQNASMAEKVLGKTGELLTHHGGVSANVDIAFFRKLDITSEAKGSIQMQNGMFHLQSSQGEVWYDGENLWTLMEKTREVNLTIPTPEELRQVNPYAIISSYETDAYAAELYETTYSDKPAYEVRLKPVDKNITEEVRLVVDKSSYAPYSIRLMMDVDSWVRLRLTDFMTDANFPASTFRFHPEQYPDVEVIDLR